MKKRGKLGSIIYIAICFALYTDYSDDGVLI